MIRPLLLPAVLAIGCSGGGSTRAEVDATPVERATVFLAFDGVTLTPGPEDAVANTTGFFDAPQTMKPYKATAADRDAQIVAVTAAVQAILAPFDLAIVMTRPAAGPYDMIVFGGSASDVGLSPDVDGIVVIDCADTAESGVALLFGDTPGASANPDIVASTAVVALGITNGIPTSTLDNDCMCWGGNGCRMTGRCSIGGPNTQLTANHPCAGGATTMNERDRFATAFGLAP